ncbi:MAG: biotin--[acetyl-CoA-carboxylase] ligase [Anaerolineaceae bacterium]|nr:biotin--[acetyl-CoA-carboxylase] ligase [Anaerolineaceae bacterium]
MNYALTLLLRRTAGEYRGLDDLASELGLSVDAVQSEIEKMAGQGFVLEQHPLLGIRLAAVPEGYDRDEIAFSRRGSRLGRTVRVYDVTGSTNDLALEMAEAGRASDGLVILAEQQTSGRGRQGAEWFASRGQSVLASVIHWAGPGVETAGDLMLATSLAVAQAAEAVAGGGVAIKWPNDIEFRRRKLAGILIEAAHGCGGGPVGYVLGLGVNVNQSDGDFPEEIAGQATSLRAVVSSGRLVDRTALVAAILEALEDNLELAESGRQAELLARYESRSDMVGRKVTVIESGEAFCGVVEAISPHYALVLRLESGQHRHFEAGSVRLV